MGFTLPSGPVHTHLVCKCGQSRMPFVSEDEAFALLAADRPTITCNACGRRYTRESADLWNSVEGEPAIMLNVTVDGSPNRARMTIPKHMSPGPTPLMAWVALAGFGEDGR